MADEPKHEDTPPTGVAIPRPKPAKPLTPPRKDAVALEETTDHAIEDARLPAPPRIPSIEDVYKLIDARLPMNIPIDVVQRLSSLPPPAPRQSLAVRATKGGGKWTAFVLAGFTVLGQALAIWVAPEYRGPVVQTAKLLQVIVSKLMEDDPEAMPDPATRELLPEPASPLLPPSE